MQTIISCKFNMDTGYVELWLGDDTMISINCTGAEDEVGFGSINRFIILCLFSRPGNPSAPLRGQTTRYFELPEPSCWQEHYNGIRPILHN